MVQSLSIAYVMTMFAILRQPTRYVVAGFLSSTSRKSTSRSNTPTTVITCREYREKARGDGGMFCDGLKLSRRPYCRNDKIALYSTTASQEAEYQTLEGHDVYEAEQTIKKSRFIGLAKHCTSWEDAQAFVSNIRNVHPKARHVCFGMCCGVNPGTERSSDDGEPTGTAGSPILNAIKGENLSDTVCVVVRYSGGIKLGAGGLIRAYGGSARLALRVAPKEILIPRTTLRLVTSSANAGSVYDLVAKANGETGGEEYNAKGEVEMTVVCETSLVDDLTANLRDATRGQITFIEEDNNE